MENREVKGRHKDPILGWNARNERKKLRAKMGSAMKKGAG